MEFRVGTKLLGEDNPAFIIAEMSGNHGGSLERALEIIHAAKRAGADAIKLQTYRADTITLDSKTEDFLIPADDPWSKDSNLYSLYEKAYTPWEWHAALYQEAKKIGIEIFSAPFDLSAVDFLEELDTVAYKIASPEITDIPLIKKVASTGKPVILSTGLAAKEDIELAVQALKEVNCTEYAFLKCTTAYPAPLGEANLLTIPKMKMDFDCLSGISDHTSGFIAAVTAVSVGGNIVEKHLKLNDSIETVDSFFSLSEDEFCQMVDAIRQAEQSLGKPCYEISDAAKKNLRGRRSLYVCQNIKAGEEITENNIKSVRPAHGLHPRYYDEVLGMKASKDLERGERLNLKFLYKE